jgi:hypothetical protein
VKLTPRNPNSNPVTFDYDKGPEGTEGYIYWKDGQPVSRTFNPDKLDVKFGKPFQAVGVEAVGFKSLDSALWPEQQQPAPDDLWARFLQWYKTEPPTPLTPNKTASSEADARAKITGLQAGDVLRVSGVTFGRSSDGTCLSLDNLPACTIEFVNSKAVHSGTTLYPVVSADHWHAQTKVYGLEITGPKAAQGIRPEDSRGLWWGFEIHDVGATGLMPVSRLAHDGPYDYRGEISRAGLDPARFDPHGESGTGIHGAYLGGSGKNITGTTGTFVLHVHDQPTGAGLQLGGYLFDSTVAAWCERLTFNAQSQVAGNALQWWGGNLRNVRVPFVYGEELAGRISEVDGVYSGTAQSIVHEFGRGERVCLNPRLSNVAFATGKTGFTYRDCEATYA